MPYTFPASPTTGAQTPDGKYEYDGTAWVPTGSWPTSPNFMKPDGTPVMTGPLQAAAGIVGRLSIPLNGQIGEGVEGKSTGNAGTFATNTWENAWAGSNIQIGEGVWSIFAAINLFPNNNNPTARSAGRGKVFFSNGALAYPFATAAVPANVINDMDMLGQLSASATIGAQEQVPQNIFCYGTILVNPGNTLTGSIAFNNNYIPGGALAYVNGESLLRAVRIA